MLLPITALHRNEIFTRAASISCYRSCRNSSKLGLLIKAELFKTRASCSSSQGLPCQLGPTDSIRGQGLARALWACRVTIEVTFWSEQTLECFCQKRKATQADCDLSVRAACHRWWWQHSLLPFDLPGVFTILGLSGVSLIGLPLQAGMIPFILFIYLCTRALSWGACAMEGNLQAQALSSYHVASRDGAWAIKHGGKDFPQSDLIRLHDEFLRKYQSVVQCATQFCCDTMWEAELNFSLMPLLHKAPLSIH